MTLLAYNELLGLVKDKVIEGVTPSEINSSSIDLTLGDKILYEDLKANKRGGENTLFLSNRERLNTLEFDLNNGPYRLHPGEFILAQSRQVFNLPNNISAEYKLKSSMARIGLEHLNAGWCDAGWNGSVLTLELKNMTSSHIIVLEKGVPCGQMVFFEHEAVPANRSYAARGRYNNDKTVSGIKE